MDRFTVEEINLMCIFNTANRGALLSGLRDCLPDIDEPEIAELVRTVIGKLEDMTDEDFAEIGFYPADDFEEQED